MLYYALLITYMFWSPLQPSSGCYTRNSILVEHPHITENLDYLGYNSWNILSLAFSIYC